MANASGTPQGALYAARGANTAPFDGNAQRNRSAEQQYSQASGNPYNYQGRGNGMNYAQFLNGQDPSLSRYVPSTLRSNDPARGTEWNNNPGGYAYNLPTSFGGFGGFSQFSRQNQPPAQRALQGMGQPQFGNRLSTSADPNATREMNPAMKPQSIGAEPTYQQLLRMLGPQPGGSIGGPNRYTV